MEVGRGYFVKGKRDWPGPIGGKRLNLDGRRGQTGLFIPKPTKHKGLKCTETNMASIFVCSLPYNIGQ